MSTTLMPKYLRRRDRMKAFLYGYSRVGVRVCCQTFNGKLIVDFITNLAMNIVFHSKLFSRILNFHVKNSEHHVLNLTPERHEEEPIYSSVFKIYDDTQLLRKILRRLFAFKR